MPEQELGALIRSAVEDALETMFFTTLLGVSEPGSAAAEAGVQARVPFRGTPSGTCTMYLDWRAARRLTANLLGELEPDVGESEIMAVSGELTNILAGSVISRMQSEALFELGTPEVVPVANPPQLDVDCPGRASRSFALERGTLTLALEVGQAG